MPRIYRKYARRPRKMARRPKKTRLAPARKKVDKKQNTAIRKLLKDVRKLKSDEEVKMNPLSTTDASGISTLYSSGTSTTAPVCLTLGSVAADINAGITSTDRIGDVINVRSWYHHLRISMLQAQFGTTTFTLPIRTRIIIARPVDRDAGLITDPTVTEMATLLHFGTTTAYSTTYPENTYQKFNLPINKVRWRVLYDKQHVINPLTAASEGVPTSSTWYSSSLQPKVTQELNLVINLKKHIAKKLKYSTTIFPDNFKAWFLFHMAVPTGYNSSMQTGGLGFTSLAIQDWQRLKYTDS
jgi:hypothetical protein